jgi:hypothetical protein
MAIYPGARVRLIPPGANDPRIKVRGAILHTDAGDSKSLYGYFNGPSGGIESHFHIPKVNQVEQYRDTAFEADANYHGNSFELGGVLWGYVSIETQGLATDKWNDYQLREIKDLLLWASKTHDFPLVKCTSPTAPGVGYHTMWGAPGPWTPVAKDCPGAKRIAQFNNVLIPWFKTADKSEEDMPLTNADADLVISRLLEKVIPVGTLNKNVRSCLSEASFANDAFVAVKNLAARPPVDVAALAAAIVAKLPAGQSINQATVEAGVRAALGTLDGD